MCIDQTANPSPDADGQKLVVSSDALSDRRVLHRDMSYIKSANELFSLGISRETLRREAAIAGAVAALGNPNAGGVDDLFYYAIAKKLPKESKELIAEEGMADERIRQQIWRRFGFTKLAALLDEWQDLADGVELTIVGEDGCHYAEIANEAAVKENVAGIEARMQPLLQDALFSPGEIATMVCREFCLDPRPLDAFNQYWVSRIAGAAGFLSFEPEEADEGWFLEGGPFGWLTKRHGAALSKHGYTFKFAFWAQEIGRSRGHLWIQTDRGPLRLTDRTDAVSLRSNFPILVSDIQGERLFELQEKDVPKYLMNDGPDFPPSLSPRR